MEERFAIGVLVHNRFGALTRVAGLFARRGFNIDSLTVGVTENPDYSRMTITARGDDYIKEQIVKQLSKIYDVVNVKIMGGETVYRELMLIKVQTGGKRTEILEVVNIYRANVVDVASESITIELTGETGKLNSFVDHMRPYGILEICRTGLSAVERGGEVLTNNVETIG